MIDLEAEFDRLAADLAVLDVAGGAGTRVNRRLKALAAIRALDHVKLHAAWGGVIGHAGLDYRLETVLHIDALRIVLIHVVLECRLAGNGPFHCQTIRPKQSLVNGAY